MTSELWWANMGNYNQATFAVQMVSMAVGMLLSVLMGVFPGEKSGTALKAFLAFNFSWTGIVFFIIMGEFAIPQKVLQGGVFLLIGGLLFYDIFKKNISFKIPSRNELGGIKRIVFFVSLMIVFCYPFIGFASGREFPHIILFGLLPCSSTAFALTLLSAARVKKNKLLFILLLIWAIPFPPLVQVPQYGVYEDLIMFFIGIYGLFIFVSNWKAERNVYRNIQKH